MPLSKTYVNVNCDSILYLIVNSEWVFYNHWCNLCFVFNVSPGPHKTTINVPHKSKIKNHYVPNIRMITYFNPPASEASREVVNFIERKNPHTPVYGVKEFVCLSVRLWQTLTPIISGLAEQNGLKNIYLTKYGNSKFCIYPFYYSKQKTVSEKKYPD